MELGNIETNQKPNDTTSSVVIIKWIKISVVLFIDNSGGVAEGK